MTLLSNIWRNEKSREIIIQIFVLFCIGWLLSWLVMNVNANFKALGKDISFEFLFIPAGYDINQYLIDYNNRDSHLRAGIVGLLNTGLVAVLIQKTGYWTPVKSCFFFACLLNKTEKMRATTKHK